MGGAQKQCQEVRVDLFGDSQKPGVDVDLGSSISVPSKM